MASVVLTVVGDDRAGLVSALADVVAFHGGSWQRSQMAELAGKFAGIVLVAVPDSRVDALAESLRPLQESGLLEISIAAAGPEVQAPPSARVALELIGQDRPGIIAEISKALASHDVSIDELTTETVDAAMAGGMLFKAQAVLEVPLTTDLAAIQAVLEDLANELMVDVDLSPVTD